MCSGVEAPEGLCCGPGKAVWERRYYPGSRIIFSLFFSHNLPLLILVFSQDSLHQYVYLENGSESQAVPNKAFQSPSRSSEGY